MFRARMLASLVAAASLSLMSGLTNVIASDDPATLEIEGTATVLTGNVTPAFIPNELVRLPNSLIGQPGPGGFQETFRFDSGDVTVRSGGTVKWINTTNAPHSITFVRQSDQPQTLAAAFACFVGICGATLQRHFPQGFDANGNPIQVVPDLGTTNVGDSHLVGPVGSPFRITFQTVVNAPPGSVLFFMCVFHPQMQSKIIVEGN